MDTIKAAIFDLDGTLVDSMGMGKDRYRILRKKRTCCS